MIVKTKNNSMSNVQLAISILKLFLSLMITTAHFSSLKLMSDVYGLMSDLKLRRYDYTSLFLPFLYLLLPDFSIDNFYFYMAIFIAMLDFAHIFAKKH